MGIATLSRRAAQAKSGLTNAALLLKYLQHSKRVNRLAQLSMPAEENQSRYGLSRCPICHGDDYHPLLRVPFGYPKVESDSLFYYDHTSIDMGTITPDKELLDQTLGFAISIPWNFCNRCNNGSLALALSQDHLDLYYSGTYERVTPHQVNRRSTKELHGRFVCQFLKPGSRVLEIGAADGFTAEYLVSQGHDVIACEPSEQYHQRLNMLSGLTFTTDLSDIPKNSLDAIYLDHVFEHIASPIEYARSLHGLLKPAGLLFIQVPDLSLEVSQCAGGKYRSSYSILNRPAVYKEHIGYDFWSVKNWFPWFGVLLYNHVSAFTPEGLGYAVQESGFEVETMLQSTADRITWDPEHYSWPVDAATGNTPNSLSLVARKG